MNIRSTYWRRLKKSRPTQSTGVRRHRATILLNDKELEAIDAYCKKYRVSSRSQFCREAIISVVLRRFEEDHPKLF